MDRERFGEKRLIKRALNGEREAAESLIAANYPSVVRFLLHLTGHINEAEELAQETFVKAWQRLASFEGRSSLRTWLHSIAYREYMLRRNPPEYVELSEDQADLGQNFVGPLVDAIAMEHAIASLPDQLRITFLICQVQQISAREAAEILSVPIGTVLSRMHTARERLRRYLTMREIVSGTPTSEHSFKGAEGTHKHEMSKAVR